MGQPVGCGQKSATRAILESSPTRRVSVQPVKDKFALWYAQRDPNRDRVSARTTLDAYSALHPRSGAPRSPVQDGASRPGSGNQAKDFP